MVPLTDFMAMAATITLAYVVFGMTGFGAAMVAVPVLVMFVPLKFAVPMMVFLDVACTVILGLSNRRKVSVPELKRLLPFAVVGIFAGATVLANAPAKGLLLLLGVFVTAMSLRMLLARKQPDTPIAPGWVAPAGLVGGVFSALFGTGGPIYTMYLARRLPLEELRATMAAVIFLSAVLRLVSFASAGLFAQEGLLWTAFGIFPFGLLGLYLGSRLRRRVPEAALKRVLLVVLTVAGAVVLMRALALP
jgi:uncharacterized membrane protein YfcA